MSKPLTLPQYIERVGAANLAEKHEIDPATVSYWKSLRSAPLPLTADELIRKSRGLLTWESIYAPYVHDRKIQMLANKG